MGGVFGRMVGSEELTIYLPSLICGVEWSGVGCLLTCTSSLGECLRKSQQWRMNPLWDLVTQGVPLSIQGTPEALTAIDPNPPSTPGGPGLKLAHIWTLKSNHLLRPATEFEDGSPIPPLLGGGNEGQGKQLGSHGRKAWQCEPKSSGFVQHTDPKEVLLWSYSGLLWLQKGHSTEVFQFPNVRECQC